MARLDPELLVHHEGVLYARDEGAAIHLSTRRRNHEGDHEPTGDRKTDALHARRLRGAVSGLGSGPMPVTPRSEEHTSELQSLMRISYAVFCLKKKTQQTNDHRLD